MDDSMELPVKKVQQSDTQMITALQLWYRAIQATNKSVIDDGTYWLIQGGYTEEDKKTLGVFANNTSIYKQNFKWHQIMK
jgi:hypothetical protein